MIINTAATLFLTLAALVLGMWATWPSVPWVPLAVATVLAAGITPIVFYPLSKTLWMAFELSYHRLEDAERLAAIERIESTG